MLLFVVVALAMVWMHLAIRQMEQRVLPENMPELPEMEEIHIPERHDKYVSHTLSRFGIQMIPFFGKQPAKKLLDEIFGSQFHAYCWLFPYG